MAEQKFCESCGMSLRQPEEFGGGKLDNPYCVFCCDEQGVLKTYEQVLEGMTQFAIRTMGVSESAARKTARENMAKMSAWAGQG